MNIIEINVANSQVAMENIMNHLERNVNDIFLVTEHNERYLPLMRSKKINIINNGRSAIITKLAISQLWNGNMEETTVGLMSYDETFKS